MPIYENEKSLSFILNKGLTLIRINQDLKC